MMCPSCPGRAQEGVSIRLYWGSLQSPHPDIIGDEVNDVGVARHPNGVIVVRQPTLKKQSHVTTLFEPNRGAAEDVLDIVLPCRTSP